MTAAPDRGRPGGQVLALVPPAPQLGPARPGREPGMDQPVEPPAGGAAPAAPLDRVLDAYARQSDAIATLVEDWRATLPDTASTRRYTRAVLAALGELHVALDTAAHLAQHRAQPATTPAGPLPPYAVPVEEPEHISDDGLTALCGQSLIDPDPPQRPLCPTCVAARDRADCGCREQLVALFADRGIDMAVSAEPPLVPSPYEDLGMRCPHGIRWYTEPTSDQQLAWTAADGGGR